MLAKKLSRNNPFLFSSTLEYKYLAFNLIFGCSCLSQLGILFVPFEEKNYQMKLSLSRLSMFYPQPTFLSSFIHNSTVQNKIKSKMDEVENDSSNFICHRTEKANTQARRLVSKTILHQTNTGNSSRFKCPVMCFSVVELSWVNIWLSPPFHFYNCAQETVEDTGSEGPDPDKIVRRRRRYIKPPRTVVNPDENFYFYWLMVLTMCVLYNLWTLIVRQSFPELQVSHKL